ncbi:type IV pilin protein [Shewanella schlegeliana]|uniref:Type IV pilin protein n=1 Tax=Shewanella schlegeliana TaxID=190308 RepID=A0ABS1SUA2_9GAMM|nr:type IV pilin protein [Shewanella schlegeliana]MBL4912127.1 type IV pilin protein [Shewanella schlegeliana]MCL1110787.1 type IV pilin protein [Shewanella schlegeliana]GIU22934.1 type IV minor pilin protein PilE [Shewanella schlegeliana]
MLRIKGFTLIELMIAVAIIGILASVAYPSYVEYVAQSGRSDAKVMLLDAANQQEQFYLDNRNYTTNMTLLGFDETPAVSENGFYKVSSTVPNSGSYTLTATAQGTQYSRDKDCRVLTITDSGVKSPAECW